VATPETAGKPAKAPQPGVSRVVAPAPVGKPWPEGPGKAPKPVEVSGDEAAPEPADAARPEGSGKGKPKQ
jgi:hypothetical protein